MTSYELLKYLGIPCSRLGYKATSLAIAFLQEDPSLIRSITKGLYPRIAEIMGLTGTRVERNIRSAVDYMLLNGDSDAIDDVFGAQINPHTGRITNGQFLAACYAYLEAQDKKKPVRRLHNEH